MSVCDAEGVCVRESRVGDIENTSVEDRRLIEEVKRIVCCVAEVDFLNVAVFVGVVVLV